MKSLNGYRATHRNKWLLIKHNILTLQEVSLLEYYADIFDFDKKHKNFGTIEVYFSDISSIFGKSENTIRSWHNKLLSLGFIEKTFRLHVYKLKIPARYITPGLWKGEAAYYAEIEKDQSIETILLNFGINIKNGVKKTQSVEKKSDNTASKIPPIALGSSKDQSRDNLTIEEIPTIQKRSKQEYEEILQEGNYKEFEASDLELIDQLLTKELPSSQTESTSLRPTQKEKILKEKEQKVIEIPLVNHFQLTPTERFYVAIADKFPDPNSYFAWKERKQKSGQWKN